MNTKTIGETIAKALLAAGAAGIVALALAAKPALAGEHHHHHGPHYVTKTEKVKVARHHDHGLTKYDYRRHGDIVHSHSGYGRHAHIDPYKHDRRYRGDDHRGHHEHHVDKKELKKKKKVKTFLKVFGAIAGAKHY